MIKTVTKYSDYGLILKCEQYSDYYTLEIFQELRVIVGKAIPISNISKFYYSDDRENFEKLKLLLEQRNIPIISKEQT